MDTVQEWSDAFDVLLNSHSQKASFGDTAGVSDIVLDEYEKSVFLTQAQQEVVINLYNGKNIYGDSFESTEEIRRYLDSLIVTATAPTREGITPPEDEDLIEESSTLINIKKDYSTIYKLPKNLAYITLEKVKYGTEDDTCVNAWDASVQPVTHDEYNMVKNNPFRGATKYKALRLDYGEGRVEIISKYEIAEYYIKYLKKPKPIILVDLTSEGLDINGEQEPQTCELNSMLHHTILTRAVALAVASRGKVSQ